MKNSIVLVVMSLTFFILFNVCNSGKKVEQFTPDTTLDLVHGTIINAEGRVILPGEGYIIQAQSYYISELSKQLVDKNIKDEDKVKRTIYGLIKDRVIANALYLDWLIDVVQPLDKGYLNMVNNSLRWYYVVNIQKNPVLPSRDGTWTKGIETEIANKPEFNNLNVLAPIHAGSPTYRQNCLDEGVPIPINFNDENFISVGNIETNYAVDEANVSELKIYKSEDPPGFCLSLSRFRDGNKGFYDVICFGTQSNNACFFETSLDEDITLDGIIPYSKLYDPFNDPVRIPDNCTRCHLGENPFFVHPDDNAFKAALDTMDGTFMGTDWYNPIIPIDWRGNTGPDTLLKLIPSKNKSNKKCSSCHHKDYAGRFPIFDRDCILQGFSGSCTKYCGFIKYTLNGRQEFGPTMPLNDLENVDDYINDINWLLRNCENDPGDNGSFTKVDFPDDPNFTGAPVVDNRLYQCAKKLIVKGVSKRADVTLFINNVSVAKQINAKPINGEIVFNNLNPLSRGDTVTANQELDGTLSDFSTGVIVRDHREDYPTGIPTPIIEPDIIYECASVLSVRYEFTGAELILSTNGGSAVTGESYEGYEFIKPGITPFETGFVFTVQAKMCDELSSVSEEAFAVDAPEVLPPATISDLQVNQQILNVGNLTYGSESSIVKSGVGIVAEFRSPLSWYRFYMDDPVIAEDEITGLQILCDNSSEIRIPLKIKPCNELQAPLVKPPVVGENFVVILTSIGEARIHVFDQSGNEIGDSTGPIVMLGRELKSGDLIYVIQALGDCRSQLGHSFKL